MRPDPPVSDPRDAFFDVEALKKGISRRVGNASVLVLMISFLKIALMFGGVAIVARLIPPAEYGIFALAMPAVAIALALSNFGLPQAIVQRKIITHAEVSTLFWTNLGFAIFAGMVVFLSADYAARIFNQPEVAGVYRAISPSIMLAAVLGQYGAMMRRRLRITQFAVLGLCGEICGLAVAIVTALMGWSYWALVAQQITSQAVSVTLAILVTGWKPSGPHKARFGQVTDALSFGGYIAGMGILNRLMTYTGTAIAGAQLGPAATGLYTRSVQLANLPAQRIMRPLSGTIVPGLSRLQDEPEAMRALFRRMISRANLLLLPVAALIAAGAEPMVSVLLGPAWAEAAPLMFWFSLMTLRTGANQGIRYTMLAHGYSKQLFFNTVIRFLIVSGTIYLAAPHGLVSMAAAYMLVEFFVTLPMMIGLGLYYTPLTLRDVWQASLSGMLFAVVVAAGLIWGVNPWLEPLGPVVHFFGLVGVIGVIYGLRVSVSPALRRDVGNAFGRLLNRLPGRRRPAE